MFSPFYRRVNRDTERPSEVWPRLPGSLAGNHNPLGRLVSSLALSVFAVSPLIISLVFSNRWQTLQSPLPHPCLYICVFPQTPAWWGQEWVACLDHLRDGLHTAQLRFFWVWTLSRASAHRVRLCPFLMLANGSQLHRQLPGCFSTRARENIFKNKQEQVGIGRADPGKPQHLALCPGSSTL